MGYGLIDTVFALFVSICLCPAEWLAWQEGSGEDRFDRRDSWYLSPISIFLFSVRLLLTSNCQFRCIPVPIMATTSWLESIQGKSFQDVTVDDNQNINTEEFIRAAKSLVTLFGMYYLFILLPKSKWNPLF